MLTVAINRGLVVVVVAAAAAADADAVAPSSCSVSYRARGSSLPLPSFLFSTLALFPVAPARRRRRRQQQQQQPPPPLWHDNDDDDDTEVEVTARWVACSATQASKQLGRHIYGPTLRTTTRPTTDDRETGRPLCLLRHQCFSHRHCCEAKVVVHSIPSSSTTAAANTTTAGATVQVRKQASGEIASELLLCSSIAGPLSTVERRLLSQCTKI